MSEPTVLLLLHGVGDGDPQALWQKSLARSLKEAGYPGLDGVTVLAPKYPNSLKGVDDDLPIPEFATKVPTGNEAVQNRRVFERRERAIEVMLGTQDAGVPNLPADVVVDVALHTAKFVQAKNYLENPKIRAAVLTRILSELPETGRVVIVGHSLGSVIAADILRRMPPGLQVAGMVTIGSPLGHPDFQCLGLQKILREPPTNLAWWVNCWSAFDPVPAYRGVSSVFPWMFDHKIRGVLNRRVHDAESYLADPSVATVIGYALFGSQCQELAVISAAFEASLDSFETVVLLALRYSYLVETKLKGDVKVRYAEARRDVQAQAITTIHEFRVSQKRLMPSILSEMVVDLTDPKSEAPVPGRITSLDKDQAVIPMLTIVNNNVIHPFDISVPDDVLEEALEDLTIEVGLGRQFAKDVIQASEAAKKALSWNGMALIKWALAGFGTVALLVATGGLALSVAPGAGGAAALAGAFSSFGLRGMIGGLLAAGTLFTAGNSGVVVMLASSETSAEAVEAVLSIQLSAALLRQRQGLPQDSRTWAGISNIAAVLRRELARVSEISDESAPSVKELKKKLATTERALKQLEDQGLAPNYLIEE